MKAIVGGYLSISSSGKLAISCLLLGSINTTIADQIVLICYQYVGNFIIELFLEFYSSIQQCAGYSSKKITWRSAKPIHFLWNGWFSDTISGRSPTYVMSSCISPSVFVNVLISLNTKYIVHMNLYSLMHKT